MDRKQYCDRVLSFVRRADPDEKAAIRRELEAHIEDHAAALIDIGYAEDEAMARAVAAMGDPEQTGRELDAQYPAWWLVWTVLGRAAVLLTVMACVWTLFGVGVIGFFIDSVTARIKPDEISRLESLEDFSPLDIRIPVGNDVVRVYGVGIGQRGGDRMAAVSLCGYDRIPGGIVSDSMVNAIRLRNPRGEDERGGGGRGNYCVSYKTLYVPIEPGDSCVTLQYDRFGERFEIELPLPEGGVEG